MEVIRDHTAYAYSKLPSPTFTRLLELQPSEDPDVELRCRLYAVELYDPETPFYEAISYTWGTNTLSHTLVVDMDGGTLTHLLITTNLSDALRRLRSHDTPRVLWADAVCINQRDDAEKSRHIPLMTDIYRGASGVLVWLGGNWAEEEQALLHIKQIARHINSRSDAFSFDLHRQGLTDAVTSLVHLPWFSRRWVIQEVVLNADVVLICGSQQLSFGRLGQLVDLLSAGENGALVDWKGFSAMFELWKRSALAFSSTNRSSTLLDLMDNFEHFGCADARDRIYTLLAFATDVTMSVSQDTPKPLMDDVQRNPTLLIDYSSSIEDVYISTAISLVEAHGMAWVLIQAMKRREYGQKQRLLPSWVPDWATPPQRRLLWEPRYITKAHTGTCPGKLSKLQATEGYLFQTRLAIGVGSKDDWSLVLKVSAKSSGCPAATSNRLEIVDWIRSTFFEMWNRYRDTQIRLYRPNQAELEQSRENYIERFAKVITMEGQFRDELEDQYKDGLAILDRLLALLERHSQNTCARIVSIQQSMRTCLEGGIAGNLPSNHQMELSFRFSIQYLLDVDDLESVSTFYPILDLVAITMRDRCAFRAELDGNPEGAVEAHILGIGPLQLTAGDKIIYFKVGDVIPHVNLPVIIRAREIDPSLDAGPRADDQHFPGHCMYTFIGDCFILYPEGIISDHVPEYIEFAII